MAYATAMVRKLDNGYRGRIENESSRGLFKKGDEIFNRQFHPFPKGSYLRVLISFTSKGRRMVKKVEVATPEEVVTSGITGREIIASATKIRIGPVSTDGSTTIWTEDELKLPKEEEVVEVKPPRDNKGYFVSQDSRLVFNTVLGMSQHSPERAVKVMMVGPSGYGKTTLPKLFSELAGKRFLRMNCATVRDPEEWFGYREARDGSTHFIRSAFAKTLEEGDVVVVLDEFNRLEPWLHNTLFPLLDDDGCTVVHDEKFSIGPGVIVVGTINTGYRYTGTFELDEALLNRFEFILEVGPMPHKDEVGVLIARTGIDGSVAESIVKTANILRQSDIICSTRTSLLVANMVVSGLFIREAFETAVVKRIPVDSSGSALRKQVVDLINTQLGPVEDRRLKNDLFNLKSENGEALVKKHKLTLFLGDSGKLNTVKLMSLLHNLDVIGSRISMMRASKILQDIQKGETIVLELTGKPDNLVEFTSSGLSGRYQSTLV